MIRTLFTVAFAVFMFAQSVCAQTTLQLRREMSEGTEPYDIVGVFLPGGHQLWGFGLSSSRPDMEYGRKLAEKTVGELKLSLSGYLVVWPNQGAHGQYFIEPLGTASLNLPGKLTTSGVLGLYLPLNGGPMIVYTNTISVTRRLGDLSLGPALSFWKEEGSICRIRIGAVASLGEWQVRWLAGHGPAAEKWRLQRTWAAW